MNSGDMFADKLTLEKVPFYSYPDIALIYGN